MFGKWPRYLLAFALLWGGIWLVKVKLDELGAATATVARLETELATAKKELADQKAACKASEKESEVSYGKAAWACQDVVRRAVAVTKVVRVPVQEVVYVKDETGACVPAEPQPVVSLRDVENAYYGTPEDRQ